MQQSIRNNNQILKEIKFILPEHSPSGDLMEDVHADLEDTLIEFFGGFIVTASEQIVMDKVNNELIHDDVLVYEVPIEDTKVFIDRIHGVIKEYARKLEQDFVYVKLPNGEVYYLDTK